MDLVEIGGFWGGASKCKGPEACLMGRKKGHGWLEQTGGLGPLGGGGDKVRGWAETCLSLWRLCESFEFYLK